MNKKNNTYLTEFLKYVPLNILGMLGLSCYILADTFFVAAGLGANGLAALNLAIPIYSFVHGCGLMLGMGGATRYGVLKGQKKYEEQKIVFTNTLYLTIILSGFFFLCGIFGAHALTTALKADAAVFHMTKLYLKVTLLFAPAFMLNDLLICFVRNDGAPQLSMMAMLCGSLSNIVLDYIFIFPLRMGMFGAIFATGLAAVISIFILLKHFLKKNNSFCLVKTKLHLRLSALTLSLGLPSLITEASSGVVIIVFNTIILSLQGNVGVAAYGVIANISLVVIAIYTGIAQGVQPLATRAYSQNDTTGMKRLLYYALMTVTALSLAIYTGIYCFSGSIAAFFNSEENQQLQALAAAGLKLYFTGALFAGCNIIFSIFFTAFQKPFPAQIISALRGFALIIPIALFLSVLWGITGVWLTFPVTEGMVLLCSLFFYSKYTALR